MSIEYTYEEKALILRSHGWETLWSEDNWIKSVWREDRRLNLDWAGSSTDNAFEQVMKEYKGFT